MIHNLLLKFGASEHIQAFLERGELYLNPLEEYRKAEHNEQRRDKREGALRQTVSTGGALCVSRGKSGPWHELPGDFTLQEQHTNRELLTLNVLCLFMLTCEDTGDRHIGRTISDEVITKFGDSVVVIFDPVEFLRRTKAKAERQGLRFEGKPVIYQDLAMHTGDIGPFVKDIWYASQREFRIAIDDPARNGDALKLEIGTIDDIAWVMPASGVRDLILDVSENDGEGAK